MSGNYKNSKIYIIRSSKTESVYVGSTYRTLECRFSGHKSTHKSGKHKIASSIIFDYGVEYAYIELLEEYPCNSRDELLKREGQLMRTMNNCINKENPYDEYLEKRLVFKNSEEYKANIKFEEEKKKLMLIKRENKIKKEKEEKELEDKKREIEWKKQREIEKEIESKIVRPKNLDIELEKENIAKGILPFNTSKDGRPMFVRENREAYYEYRHNILRKIATLYYKLHKEEEEKKEKEKEKETVTEIKEEEKIKRKKTKKQIERGKEKQLKKEKEKFTEFYQTKEFKSNMIYINYLEDLKIANGREWLEDIYKNKCNLELYKIECGNLYPISCTIYNLIGELLSPESTENIYVFLKEKYNLDSNL
jgi:hypothetical protein